MSYLIKFSFGPVQDFISAARKLEDLWSGSRMLGDLMESAHDHIEKQKLGQIIYPVANTSKVSLPNTFMLEIPGNENPGKIGASIEKVVKDKFRSIINAQFENIRCLYNKQITEQQVSTFPEIHWAGVRTNENNGFEENLKALNKNFAAVKMTRIFASNEQPGLKCTLQPQLSVLMPEKYSEAGIEHREIRNFWRTLNGRSDIDVGIKRAIKSRDGERFSSIGLAKRLYRREAERGMIVSPFPSTYAVATALWRYRILETAEANNAFAKELETLVTEAEKIIQSLMTGISSQVYMLDVLSGVIPGLIHLKKSPCGNMLAWESQVFLDIEEEKNDPGLDQKKELAEFIRKIILIAKKYELGTPPKHYAFIMADGDSMGDIVKSRKSRSELRELSENLGLFAGNGVKTIEESTVCGRVIYAGGDDLLAVTPVETALDAACYLRRNYREKMKDYGATLSAAVIIAPVNYPMNRLLRELHHALENHAKKDDKDAMAVSVIKGDSHACSAVLPAERNPETVEKSEVFCNFEKWAKHMGTIIGSKGISSKSIHDLRQNLNDLESAGISDGKLISDMVAARLSTNRNLKSSQVEIMKKYTGMFLSELDIFRRETRDMPGRFSSASLLAETLLTLRNIRRLSCLSE
ncbi:MAG: type III-B CRISPR-associated protein Cas10/Cmr2 [Desulfobacterales bacterium]|nr:type III-B CRISPR-associated protein Cas10/Cmr2 [Desulfobacterales bacterium]